MFVLRNALHLQNQPFLQRRRGPFVNAVALFGLLLSLLGFSFEVRLLPRRLQNSPYFCVFKYARAVQQKVWNEAENKEQDWGETLKMWPDVAPHDEIHTTLKFTTGTKF